MGLIREPLDVDFTVDPRPLSKEEREQISNYIIAYKAKHANREFPKNKTHKNLPSRKKVVA